MHSQFNFKKCTCLFILQKRIVVTPGITDETISSCRRPALFGSRVLYEIGILLVGAHGGRNGHLVLFLVALSFSKLQTFLNNIPEGNPLKSVYLTPKIAFTFRSMWSLNGRVAYTSLS